MQVRNTTGMYKKVVLIIALFALSFPFFIVSSPSTAQEPLYQAVLILPHVEANSDFFTGLSLLNRGEETSDIKITAYNKNGKLIGQRGEITLSPGARYLSSITDMFGYDLSPEISWVRIDYTGELSGIGLLGNDGQLTRLPLKSEGKESLILPYVISGEGLFTQLYILNTGSDYASVLVTLYDSTGEMLKSVPLELPLAPGQKMIASLKALFGPEVAQDGSWIKVESEVQLMGLGLIGTTDRLFSVPME
jgi:hypothetical protein